MIQHLKIEKKITLSESHFDFTNNGSKVHRSRTRISKMEYITYKVLLFRPCKESPKVHANSIYRPLKAITNS